jgi:hypothetical protein
MHDSNYVCGGVCLCCVPLLLLRIRRGAQSLSTRTQLGSILSTLHTNEERSLHLIIYDPITADPITADQRSFIDFWADRYAGYDEKFYDANVGQELTEERVLGLFVWKNGKPLSKRKRESVIRNFISRRDELEQVSPDESASNLLRRFSKGGVIFRIFWLHCWRPVRFPIYDQHVYRAMRFIESGVLDEIPRNDARKIRTYLDNYISFQSGFDGATSRQVDKALWAFGKFLKENNFPTEAPW